MSLVLISIAVFAGFGLLASFELPGITVWHISYAAVGLACLGTAGWMMYRAFRSL